MKVAVVASAIHRARAGLYGSEPQAAVLAQGLEKAGHEVAFLAAAGSTPVGRFLPVPCMYGSILPNEEVKQYEWYRDILVEQDLILDWSGTHRVAENMYFWERDKFKGVLLWCHNGNQFPSPRPPVIGFYHGVVVSEAQKKSGLDAFPASPLAPKPENVHVVPYGIDTDTYRPVPDPTRAYFLYLSRPHPDKGLFDFIKLAQETPEEQFVMAFDMAAPDHVQYGKLAIEQAKGVPNLKYIPLKGSLERKVALYANAKALVIPLAPSYIEGFGLVFAEALACGTPVITAAHGSPREVLNDGVGFMCGSEEAYGEALRLLDRLDYSACRPWVESQFSVAAQVEKYVQLYETLRWGQNP